MPTTRHYIDLTVELRGLDPTSDAYAITLTAPEVGESGEVKGYYSA